MKAKDKGRRTHMKITLKNIITFLGLIISLLYIVIFYNYYFGRNNVYASETLANIEENPISQAEEIDIEEDRKSVV